MWHSVARTQDDWVRKYDIVQRAAAAAGRDPAGIETGITIERPLPETDTESAELHELISGWHHIGVDHVVMDFGNPASTEPILRFVDQVIAPLR
jgi:alkanesulfonate monooxygenase SsuD/methylene tetrahydromethanopterin reductase-like flavin-dependent oxidoreductase (luciferase family)